VKALKIVFYITNHGYGHASRNVAIISRLLELQPETEILIKTDEERCAFIRRNFPRENRIRYFNDCSEVGLILKEGTLEPDVARVEHAVNEDMRLWPNYIRRECAFLKKESPELVIADIICWAIYCARQSGIKSILVGNFTWASLYRSFFPQAFYQRYLDYYRMADCFIWYEIHDKELEGYGKNTLLASLVSRKTNAEVIARIKREHENPIVFISLGASASVAEAIDVSDLPYDFIITRGIHLTGDNVTVLPSDVINTPDYIGASDYVIAKGGWSTVSEILLQHKRCCLLRRGINTEDEATRLYLENRQHCICIDEKDLQDIGRLIDCMKALSPAPYEYRDSTEEICRTILNSYLKAVHEGD